MRPYEAMVVLRPNLEQDALEAVLTRLTDVVTDQGGQITHVDQWGKRRLAYEIDGLIEGYYVVIKFQGDPGITTELERIMRITDSVMRFLVVRDEFPTAVPQTSATGPEADGGEASGNEPSQDAGAAAGTDAAAEEAESSAEGDEAADEPAEKQQ